MTGIIKITNSGEVAENIFEITELLMRYEEIFNEDINSITSVEGDLFSARDRIKVKISELEIALQRTKAMSESSEKAASLVKEYETKISKYNKDLQYINHFQHELNSLKNEMMHIEREITSISQVHHNLQNKINTMLNKINEAF